MMKKMLIAMLLVLAMVCVTAPAMAKSFTVISTSGSGAFVASGNGTFGTGISGSFEKAGNQSNSYAGVSFGSQSVSTTTNANSGGGTIGGSFHGFAIGAQGGFAGSFATGTKN